MFGVCLFWWFVVYGLGCLFISLVCFVGVVCLVLGFVFGYERGLFGLLGFEGWVRLSDDFVFGFLDYYARLLV